MKNSQDEQEEGWKSFTRGAEIWMHQTRMMMSSVLIVLMASILIGFMSLYMGMTLWLSPQEGYYTEKYVEASFKTLLWPSRAKVMLVVNDKEREVTGEQAKAVTAVYKDYVLWKLYILSLFGLGMGVATFAGVLWYLTRYGNDKMSDDHLRGGKITDGETLKDEIISRDLASHLSLAGVPLVKGKETYHINIIGSPGTGKTVAILDFLDQLRAAKIKVAIYDPTGQFIEHFYRDGHDVILNPLDKRSRRWTPWMEVRRQYDYMNLAESLIPKPAGTGDPFWALAGRQIFEDTCLKLAEKARVTNKELYNSLALENLDKIYELLAGTAGAAYVAPSVEKTGQSVRMVVINALKSFRFLHDDGDPFSIRDWIEDEFTDSWLFMSTKESQKTALEPLISLWMDIIVRYSMDLKPAFGIRHIIVLEELASLQKLESLELGLGNLRKYGVPIVTGFQLYPQIEEKYGKHITKAIIAMSQTKLVLRTTDGETASELSEMFGEAEIDEKEETFSYGINAQRDGVSVFAKRQMRDLIIAGQILYLPDRTGYMVVPGDFPVAKVTFNYKEREILSPGFIERDDLVLSHAKPAAAQVRPTIEVDGFSVDTETGEILHSLALQAEQNEPAPLVKKPKAPRKHAKKKPEGVEGIVQAAEQPPSENALPAPDDLPDYYNRPDREECFPVQDLMPTQEHQFHQVDGAKTDEPKQSEDPPKKGGDDASYSDLLSRL